MWFSRWIVLVCLMVYPTMIYAQDETVSNPIASAPADDPAGFFQKVSGVVDSLSPSVDELWNFRDGESFSGVSAALYTIKSKEIPLGDIRMGYAAPQGLYGGSSVDVLGIADRFLPSPMAALRNTPLIGSVMNMAGKYGRVSLVGGYDFDDREPIVGIGVGARVTFDLP